MKEMSQDIGRMINKTPKMFIKIAHAAAKLMKPLTSLFIDNDEQCSFKRVIEIPVRHATNLNIILAC